MECSLLYISQRLATDTQVRDIVTVSRARNAVLHVTGALIASRNYFAQILEGSGPGVDELMISICRDQRHTDVEVLSYDAIETRRFPDWALAYSGASGFIDGLIRAVANRTTRQPDPHHLRRLVRAMEEFTRAVH
jgi:hypothetical protein